MTGESLVSTRGDSKLKADMNDILVEFKRIDENNISISRFLALDFSSMPPTSWYELISEHLIAFLSEFEFLRTRVQSLTDAVDKIQDHNITDIKEYLHDNKNMILKNKWSAEHMQKKESSYANALNSRPSASANA